MNQKRQAEKALKAAGFRFLREGSDHTIYYNRELKTIIPLKRHAFGENDLRNIRKEIETAQKRKGR